MLEHVAARSIERLCRCGAFQSDVQRNIEWHRRYRGGPDVARFMCICSENEVWMIGFLKCHHVSAQRQLTLLCRALGKKNPFYQVISIFYGQFGIIPDAA